MHSWNSVYSLSPVLSPYLPESEPENEVVEPSEEFHLTVKRYERKLWAWLYSMLNRCGPHLLQLDFRGVPMSYQLCALLSLVPNVKRLAIDNKDKKSLLFPGLQEEQMEEIGTALPRLHALYIYGTNAS